MTRTVTVTGAPAPSPEPVASVSSLEFSLEGEGALAEGSAAWLEDITYAVEAPAVPATLNVTLMGTGSGTVTSNPAGLNCSGAIGQTCSASFQVGDVVTLHQAATTGTFTGWGGACSGLGACPVTLSPATLVVARFMVPPPIVTQYYHLDVIGSVRAVTDHQGTLLRRQDYAAFGEEIASDEPEGLPNLAKQPKFAGKPRDPETGLDYFGARHYGARWGRFTAIDPKLGMKTALVDPQRWNRYSYVGNRPVRVVDPDGRGWLSTGLKITKAVVKGGSIAAEFAGVVEDVKTALDSDASLKDRGIAVASLASEIFSPISGRDAQGVIRFAAEHGDGASRFTRSTFRENLGRLTGSVEAGSHAHHVFPVKFAERFMAAGIEINVNDPRYGAWWEAQSHLQNARGYNQRWEDFFERNPGASRDDILAFGRSLAADYGFQVKF